MPTSDYTHAEEARKALARLKELVNSPLEGWNAVQEEKGVKLYNRAGEGDGKDIIVRGDTVLKTTVFTPNDVAAVATLPGCRKIWDDKFDDHEVIGDMISQWEALFWVKVKAPWPVSPRDFAGVSLRDIHEDECFVVMTSVKDDAIPERKGCVRARLLISGWRLKKVPEGVAVTYVTQVDLAGAIPKSFLKSVHQQVPLCAGEVAKYVRDHGVPPVAIKAESVRYKLEEFDHAKSVHTVTVEGGEGGNGECQWRVLKKTNMFPNGAQVKIVDGKTGEVQVVDKDDHQIITLSHIQGLTKVIFTKA